MTTSGMSVISESAVEMWIPIAAGVTILSTFSSSAFRMIRMTIPEKLRFEHGNAVTDRVDEVLVLAFLDYRRVEERLPQLVHVAGTRAD